MLKVPRDQLVPQVPLVHKVQQDLLVPQVQQVLKVMTVLLDPQDYWTYRTNRSNRCSRCWWFNWWSRSYWTTGAQGAAGSTGPTGPTEHKVHRLLVPQPTGAQGATGSTGPTGPSGSATISNNANDRVITGGSGTNLNGETNFVSANGNAGVQTSTVTSGNLVGAGNSLTGLYIGDGSLIFSNTLSRSGGYYITTGVNALNAGPVTLNSNMILDGTWVIV